MTKKRIGLTAAAALITAAVMAVYQSASGTAAAPQVAEGGGTGSDRGAAVRVSG